MKRAARCDGAMPMTTSVDDAVRYAKMVRDERARLGKDPLGGRMVTTISDMENLKAYQDLESQGVTDALVFPWTTLIPPEVANKPPRQRLPELEAFAKKLGL